MSPLSSVRHKPAQARPQWQQYHRKHNRKRHETTAQGEEETLRSVVTEFKGRRDNTTDRMEHSRNQDGDDKTCHGERGLNGPKLSDPAHDGIRLQRGRDGRAAAPV